MDVIFPVAGLGTRLRPQTWSKPKPLVSVGGKPMLSHVVDRVAPAQPRQLVFITGFLGEQIEAWAREQAPFPSAFVRQPEMRGQTDAILRTRGVVQGSGLIIFPDMIFEADFTVLESLDADGAIFTKTVDNPSAFGVVVLDGERITQLVEKPKEPVSNLAVVGIYYFRRMEDLYSAMDEQISSNLQQKGEFFIADAIQIMIDRGQKIVSLPVTAWEDCGNAEAVLSTNRYLLDRSPSDIVVPPDSAIIPPCVIDASAAIERSVVGPYVSIGPGAVVRGSVIRDAILEDGAEATNAVIEHSILGRGARVSGTVLRVNVGDLGIVE